MAQDRSVVAVFVDVRGFTRWSEANEVFINLDAFVTGFLGILKKRFPAPAHTIKPLGDGALIVGHLTGVESRREITALLAKLLVTIAKVETEFDRLCADFGKHVGHAAALKLGWGVVRGKVIEVGDDWAGHNLNKCSRLCGEARPFGLIIDRDDFPDLPREVVLVPQVRRLVGIGEVRVWVTNEIASQFTPRERLRETPEVHVAGTCITEDSRGQIKILLARRAPHRRLFPGLFEGCGGQLRYSEEFDEGVRRHFRQELELDVDVLTGLHTFYVIREANEPVIPGIRFLCKKVGDNEARSENHSELTWVTEEQFRNMSADVFVGNLKHELIELLLRYRDAASH